MRTKVVNERCRVFLELAEILSDSVADSKMSAITWIIIILIIISIFVTVTEVVLRFGMLSKGGANSGSVNVNLSPSDAGAVSPQGPLDPGWINTLTNATLEELRLWAARLSEQQRDAVCGAGVGAAAAPLGTKFVEL